MAERRAPFCLSNARTLSRKAAKRSFRAANSVRSALRPAERASTGTGGESRVRSRGGEKSRLIAAAGRGGRRLRGLTANGGSAPARGRGSEEQREGKEGRGWGWGAGLPQVPPVAPWAQVGAAECQKQRGLSIACAPHPSITVTEFPSNSISVRKHLGKT